MQMTGTDAFMSMSEMLPDVSMSRHFMAEGYGHRHISAGVSAGGVGWLSDSPIRLIHLKHCNRLDELKMPDCLREPRRLKRTGSLKSKGNLTVWNRGFRLPSTSDCRVFYCFFGILIFIPGLIDELIPLYAIMS